MKKHLHLLTLFLILIILPSCDSIQKITSITAKSSTTKLLKNSGTSGVKVCVLSDMDNKARSKDDTKQLNSLAKEIKAMKSYYVTVIGHADNTGTSEVNEAVSQQRARLVADYLKKKGVSNISTSWESYNHPVAGNDTATGRAKNRRVEVYVSTIGKYNPYK